MNSYGYKDYPKLTTQWDVASCQLAISHPYRVAIFHDEQIYPEGVCVSPYSMATERQIVLVGYFVATSISDETYNANVEVVVPYHVNLTEIMRSQNNAILVDVSSSQIVYAGSIIRFHKYPSANAYLQFSKDDTVVNFAEFVNEVVTK